MDFVRWFNRIQQSSCLHRVSLMFERIVSLVVRLAMVCVVIGSAEAEQGATALDQSALAIRDVTGLLAAGKFADARKAIAPLRQDKDPDLRVLFISGVMYMQEGRYLEAAEEFRLMLSHDPTLARPRLELARALFHAKEYDAARYHFELALATELPEAVQRRVLGYISRIRAHLPSFSFSIDAVTDSNPAQATSSKTVRIGNIDYQLNDTARAKHSRGLLLSAHGRFPLLDAVGVFARTSIDYYDFQSRSNDFLFGQALVGWVREVNRHALEVETGWQYAQYADKSLYDGLVVRLSDTMRLYPNVSLNNGLEWRGFEYQDQPFMEGHHRTVSSSLQWAPTSESSVVAGVGYTDGALREAAYSFTRRSAHLRYLKEMRNGWVTSLCWQYVGNRFNAPDPFFDVRRKDSEQSLELGVLTRRFAYKSFAPKLTVGHAARDSSIELYDYRRTYVRIGVTTEF